MFLHYITCYQVFVHIDQSTIKYIMNKLITNGRVTRWLLLLHKFNITVLDRSGKENQVAYFLSRLHNRDELILVQYNFPDENLFVVSTISPWFADITNYLSKGKFPTHLSSQENKRIIKLSASYSRIQQDFFIQDLT